MKNNDRHRKTGMTRHSPQYSVNDSRIYTVITISAVLLATTIGIMLALRNTVAADAMIWIYQFNPFVGIIIFGGLLTIGRYISVNKGFDEKSTYPLEQIKPSEDMKNKNAHNNRNILLGALILLLTYGWFGSGILSQYPKGVITAAIVVIFGITAIITIAITAYVFLTNSDKSKYAKYSGTCFISGLVLALPPAFGILTTLRWISFSFFIFGFIFDLVYEIWLTSKKERTLLINGIGVYIAVTGVFVHIIQLVLRYFN